MRKSKIFISLLILVFSFRLTQSDDQKKYLWLYASTNFQVDKNVDELITLMTRAKKLGYNGIQINDFKFGKMDNRPANYYANIKRFKEAAEKLEIDIVPGVMPIGYSNSLLINNPHLAEGIPVKDCVYVVNKNSATVSDETNFIKGGELEVAEKNKPQGWAWVDGFGTSMVLDTETKQSGKSSIKMTDFKKGNESGNCRLNQMLQLKPWQEYEVTFWAKTKELKADDTKVILLNEKGSNLCFTNCKIQKNQDWTKHQIIFNTLENTKINFYIGIWGGASGTLWLDSISLKTVGGVNLLRRAGCPIKVCSEDGKTEYQEDVDFEKWFFGKMGADPYPGSYQITHPQPPILLKPNSKIKEGQKLLVSFYHTELIYDDQICSCLLEEEIYTHLKKQVEQVEKYFAPKFYFMNHDELRIAAQCDLCKKSGKTAGQLLAYNAERCEKIIREINPKATLLIWSDMFDPFHNAVDNYYLVGSTLKDSWKGLSPTTIIANWNHDKAKESAAFFAKEGHKQLIAGYYDSPAIKENINKWVTADQEGKSICGFMYTTWQNNYNDIETFAKLVNEIK